MTSIKNLEKRLWRLLHNILDSTGSAFMGSPANFYGEPHPTLLGVLEPMLETVHSHTLVEVNRAYS